MPLILETDGTHTHTQIYIYQYQLRKNKGDFFVTLLTSSSGVIKLLVLIHSKIS